MIALDWIDFRAVWLGRATTCIKDDFGANKYRRVSLAK